MSDVPLAVAGKAPVKLGSKSSSAPGSALGIDIFEADTSQADTPKAAGFTA